jgi:Flp pilus assembly pilin Flp
MSGRGGRRLVEILRRDEGQDLVEYALLAATIGLAGAVALSLLQGRIGTAYTSWGTSTQNLAPMPEPGGGGT